MDKKMTSNFNVSPQFYSPKVFILNYRKYLRKYNHEILNLRIKELNIEKKMRNKMKN